MGIYTIPDGVISKLQVKGPASFDASMYVTGFLHGATGVDFDASAAIGSVGDTLGFYGTTPVVQALAANVTSIDTLVDELQKSGILAAT